MLIGLQIPSFNFPGGVQTIRGTLKEIAQRAEEDGFASLWVMDHLYQIKGFFGETYTDPMLEPYTTLGYFAGLTEKIKLGVLVTAVIYRHPAVLMKTVSTLDILAGGRAYLGIGAAWYEDEAVGNGIPYPPTAERFERLEESLNLAKGLWATDELSFAGKHFSAPAITNNPPPPSKPHPRILIGGTGPHKTLRMTAQYADACNIADWNGTEKMREALATLKGHCEHLGRDYASIEKTCLCTFDLAGGDTTKGTVEKLKVLADMGFTHAIFNMPGVYTMKPLEVFAKEIIPVAAGM